MVDALNWCIFQFFLQLTSKGIEEEDAGLFLGNVVDDLELPHFYAPRPFSEGGQVILVVVPLGRHWRLSASKLDAVHRSLQAVPCG